MKLMVSAVFGLAIGAVGCGAAPAEETTSHASGLGVTCDAASSLAVVEGDADPTLYALVFSGGAQDGARAEIRWDGAGRGFVSCTAPGWVELVRSR